MAVLCELALHALPDAVFAADREGCLTLVNPAAQRLVGSTELTVLEVWLSRLFLADGESACPHNEHPMKRALAGESVDDLELFAPPGQGHGALWVNVAARPLTDENGIGIGGLVVVRDITAAKGAFETIRLAREEAERANHAKSEFLHRMGQDIRSPLSSILGFAQMLTLEHLTQQQRDNVQHILNGGYRLVELIDEVLDLARIESGRLTMRAEPVRIREALKSAVDLVLPLATRSNVTLSRDVPLRCDQHVRADRQRLKQVLLGLMTVVVKSTHAGGDVTITCSETVDNQVRVEIASSNPAHDELPQAEPGGLGLEVSKRLMEAMGGTLEMESTPEQGRRFTLELCMIQDPVERLEGDGAALLALAQNNPAQNQLTILCIEDNPSNLRLIGQILTFRPGVRVLSAMQATVGLELAQAHRPDWILLDLHLPDLGGEEVLRQLQEHPKTRHIPVTILSADATPRRMRQLMAAGARDYLTKPFDVRKILQLLEKTTRRIEPATAAAD